MKIALITGATEGIGKATALALAKQGIKILILARNKQKGEELEKEISKIPGNTGSEVFIADLSSLNQVKKTAELIRIRYQVIDILINNAGLIMQNRVLSLDGYEMTFAVNHLAHFLLTLEVLESIKRSSQGRIINVSSKLHESANPDLNNLQLENNYNMLSAYNNSKLYNIYFTRELAEILNNTNVTVNALHPGVVNTDLTRDLPFFLQWVVNPFKSLFFISPEKGAETSVYLATSLEVSKTTGKYFDNLKEVLSSGLSLNLEKQKFLWKQSENLIKRALG